MSRISVIIPTFNRAQLLKEAVASVLAQTFPAFEIIIVDDGSTDDTSDVVSSMPPPVRYIHQKNSGLSAARNLGAATATGEYIAFLDSDDVWESEKLEFQISVLQSCKEIQWCVTNCVVINTDGSTAGQKQGFERLFPMFTEMGKSARSFFSQFLKNVTVEVGDKAIEAYIGDMFGSLFHGNFCSPVSLLIHGELWDLLDGFDESFRVAEETEFFHRLAGKSPGAIIMAPLIRVRRGHESIISSKNTIRLIQNALISVDRAAKSRNTLTVLERDAYIDGKKRLMARLAWAHLTNLNGREARKTISSMAQPWRQPRIIGIYFASFLPAPLLSFLHQSKRLLQRVVAIIRFVTN